MEEAASKQKKVTRIFAWISTALYLIFFLPVFRAWLFMVAILESSNVSQLFGSIYLFAWLTVPLSMPISVILIWHRYCKKEYAKANIFCLIPIFAILGAAGVSMLLSIFHCT
jgi:membrane protein YdbS with pleckstrin-like domain